MIDQARLINEKVSQDTFDSEINYLKSMLSHLKNQHLSDLKKLEEGTTNTKNMINENDYALIKALEDKIKLVADKFNAA